MLFKHKIIYRQILHRLHYCGNKVINFRCRFFLISGKKFVLEITRVVKLPKKAKNLFLEKWKNMARQVLFSEEKFFKDQASKGVKNILSEVVGKRSEDKSNTEKVIIPTVSAKERAGDDCINTSNQFTVRQNKLPN